MHNFVQCLDVELTSEGLNQRFNSKAVEFLKKMYQSIFVQQLPLPIVENRLFKRIRISDFFLGFDLPTDYSEYKGTSGSGVKIQLEYELYRKLLTSSRTRRERK